MIWAKTDAGRAEMQSRALVKERARRNLLLMIDGSKPEAMLLQSVAGISAADFTVLQELGLIALVLTLAVEKASTIEELRAVADKTVAQIGERHGEARAAAARRALYGG